jgi:hypothetical protein
VLHKRKPRQVIFDAGAASPSSASVEPPETAEEVSVEKPAPAINVDWGKGKSATVSQVKTPQEVKDLLDGHLDKLIDDMVGDTFAPAKPKVKFEPLDVTKLQAGGELGDMTGDVTDPLLVAALLMASRVDCLPDSPWMIYENAQVVNHLAQVLYGLQNQELDMHGPGFVLNLTKEGHRLRFMQVMPRTDKILRPIFKPATIQWHGKSVADLTYWNVSRNWVGGIRAVTIPVCRRSGFRGTPILGTGPGSVYRALNTFGRFCPCRVHSHLPAKNDNGSVAFGEINYGVEAGDEPVGPNPFPED